MRDEHDCRRDVDGQRDNPNQPHQFGFRARLHQHALGHVGEHAQPKRAEEEALTARRAREGSSRWRADRKKVIRPSPRKSSASALRACDPETKPPIISMSEITPRWW